MSAANNGGPAFPVSQGPDYPTEIVGGMSLRDYFAAKALPALINEPVSADSDSVAAIMVSGVGGRGDLASMFACAAYQVADAMLAERAK